jgi:hypothetical protein
VWVNTDVVERDGLGISQLSATSVRKRKGEETTDPTTPHYKDPMQPSKDERRKGKMQ